MTAERFERVLRPKIAGAWNLHLLTRGLPLDHFVLFSSAASLLGSRGQASHAAANAYLDAFAHYRRACGLSALSVNWGPWSGTGAAVRTGAAARAARTITPEAGIDALERLLAGGAVQAGVIPAAPGELTGSVPARQKPETFSLESLAGYPARKRKRELLSELQKMAAAVLGLTGAGLATPDRPMAELGLDSLMAIEFRNRLATAFRRPFPASVLFDHPSLDRLCDHIEAAVFPKETSEAPIETDPAPGNDLLADLEQLSEDEVDRMLGSRMNT